MERISAHEKETITGSRKSARVDGMSCQTGCRSFVFYHFLIIFLSLCGILWVRWLDC